MQYIQTGGSITTQAMVRVSVVIPTLNRRSMLAEAIQSIREQTYASLECLVIDDGSTDGTWALLDDLEDEWLRPIKQGDPTGFGHGRNKGIEAADGEYVVFLDSDDLLYPYAVERLVEALDAQPIDCAGAFAPKHVVTRHDRTMRRDVPTGVMSTPTLDHARAIGGPSGSIFRRDLLLEINGFDESLPSRMDLDLYLTLLKTYSLFGIDEVCTVRRLHDDQLSQNHGQIRTALRKISEKHHNLHNDKY
jgi:glycosyltransferase involved in cell wall biosynthesis